VQTIALIDYGSGNVHSASKALERAAAEIASDARIVLTADLKVIAAADRIVLPGVGAFADCKAGLARVPGLIETLTDVALVKARPLEPCDPFASLAPLSGVARRPREAVAEPRLSCSIDMRPPSDGRCVWPVFRPCSATDILSVSPD